MMHKGASRKTFGRSHLETLSMGRIRMQSSGARDTVFDGASARSEKLRELARESVAIFVSKEDYGASKIPAF
jgi:hypothetical protein